MDHHPLDRPITLAIVEDVPAIVEGVRTWIAEDSAIDLVAATSSIDALLAGPGAAADVLLLDLELYGHRELDRVHELCQEGRKVIVFSVLTNPPTIRSVLDAGAAAFLAKHESGDYCVEVIKDVAAGRLTVTPSMAGAMHADDRPQLSPNERKALLLWFQSMSKASVAHRMGITESTVRQYIMRARAKYAAVGRHATSKDALLARAIEDGLITTAEVREYRSRARRDG